MGKKVIEITRESNTTFNEDGSIYCAGCISLSNNVDVWFSPIHTIKTIGEATEVANKICKALNS